MKLLITLIIILLAPTSYAGTVTATSAAQTVVNRSNGVITSKVTFKSIQAANSATYIKKILPITKASGAQLLKRVGLTPWGAAITAAVLIAGYIYIYTTK